MHPYPCFSHVLVVIALQHLFDKVVEVVVVAEHDVAAVIPDEAVVIGQAGGEPTDVAGSFEDVPVVVVEFSEPMGGAQAGRPGAQDHDSLAHQFPASQRDE